jgi:transcriptional regulator with XRE-family HTH domain
MGRRGRYIPKRLPVKLVQVRKSLGLTQQQLLDLLDLPNEIQQSSISQYERGQIEPPIFVLLRYAEMANVWLEVLLRDNLDLPEKLPASPKSEGIKRPPTSHITSQATTKTAHGKATKPKT